MAKIKIYSTPRCKFCNDAKEYFQKKGIEYQEINVAEDMEAQQEMIQKSGQMTVPVIEIGNKILNGWNQANFEAILANAN